MENRCGWPGNDPLMIEYHDRAFMQAGGMVNDHLVHCFRHLFSFIVIWSIGFETSLTGVVNVDPVSAETHPGTIELTPGKHTNNATFNSAKAKL